MRIALYNWAPIQGPVKEGGGVALYMRNLAAELASRGHDVFALSGGYVYDLASRNVFIRRRAPRDAQGISHFDIVNSRLLAPAFMMFSNIPTVNEDAPTRRAVEAFLTAHGPFDIFHIQNIEGIPFDTLELRAKFPNTRFILSNHNYHAICQQVNLWRQDSARCTNYRGGAACYSCNIFTVDKRRVLAARIAEEWARRGSPAFLRRFLPAIAYTGVHLRSAWRRDFILGDEDPYVLDPRPLTAPAGQFAERRRLAITRINKFCDLVISVSKTVETILLAKGLDPAKSVVNYIGTRHFSGSLPGRAWPAENQSILRLGFLGYTRPDKGFHFMVDALAAMPAAMQGRLSLTFAGHISDPGAMHRLRGLAPHLASLQIIEGYKQDEIADIMQNIDLGLVLPLWDDALPQVAIEFICHGVPIFVSDRGGQQELAANPHFIFAAGDKNSFWKALQALYREPSLFKTFWRTPRPLHGMASHVNELLALYASEREARVSEISEA